MLSWSVLSFVRPAMKKTSWWLISGLYCSAALLMLGGLTYAYFVMAPMMLRFLLSIRIAGIDSMLTADNYLRFLLTQTLIVAAVFQIPLLVIAGTSIGGFDPSALAARRRHIYIAGLIALAVLTPTADVFNLGVVAIPACMIFEGSLIAAHIVKRLVRRRGVVR